MRNVPWPTLRKKVDAQIWRILDLSGMTRTVRESNNYLKAGYVYANGVLVTSKKATMPLGHPFFLEIRFPNGRTIGYDLNLIPSNRLVNRKPRQASPGTNHHINDPEKLNYRG
jgi:hypothetical protein